MEARKFLWRWKRRKERKEIRTESKKILKLMEKRKFILKKSYICGK